MRHERIVLTTVSIKLPQWPPSPLGGHNHISLGRLYMEADAMGVTVEESRLPGDYCGLYDERTNTILLDDRLNDRQLRCTLAHELIHASYHDTACKDIYMTRQERRTRRLTALRLIDRDAYKAASMAYEGNKYQMMISLGVTLQVLRDYEEMVRERLESVTVPLRLAVG